MVGLKVKIVHGYDEEELCNRINESIKREEELCNRQIIKCRSTIKDIKYQISEGIHYAMIIFQRK